MELSEKLAVWEKDLIDMSRRNPLPYFKPDGPRPSGLSLPKVNPAALYSDLVVRRSTVSDTRLQLPDPEDDPAPLRRLERLRAQARDDAKERGVQSLYMAFGMLEWREALHSEIPAYSPIVLVPVVVNRGGSQSLYTMEWIEDEDIEINPTLREWLASSFHLALPTFNDIVEQWQVIESPDDSDAERLQQPARRKRQRSTPPLNALIAGVESAIRAGSATERQNWVVRQDVYLGRFSFQKLVMRQDLERHEMEALAHPMLRRIAGERGAVRDLPNLVTADTLDVRVHPLDMLEILDADSSQQEAIQAAKGGQSFVLQGPPGTGKSQTIANIIAECLALGEKVLFVSEKMAALDVVRKRLQAAGLDDFLLDLHDTKQNKREFVNELNQAVQQARSAPSLADLSQWQRDSEELAQRRSQLNAYVQELHAKRFALQVSAFEVYGRLAQLATAQASDFTLPTDDVKAVTYERLESMRESLRQLLDFSDVLDSYWAHPWRATQLTSLSSEQSAAIENHFGRLVDALVGAETDLGQLSAALGEPEAYITFGWASYACERVRLALTSPLPPAHWFDDTTAERLRPILPEARKAATRYRNAHSTLDNRYDAQVYYLDHTALIQALTDDTERAISAVRPLGGLQPRDVALRNRQALDQHITGDSALLQDLASQAGHVAAALGLPAPQTLDGVETLVRQALLVAESPVPPRAWLDPDTYAEARIAALDAADNSLLAQQSHSVLSALYDPAYLEADMQRIDDSFRAQYDSFLRYLRPQFYLDLRTLRRFLLPDVARTVSELRGDVAGNVKLRQIEKWFQTHRADHARLFGRQFAGEQTDWQRLRRMVEWTDGFHDSFGGVAPEATVKLVIGSATARTVLTTSLFEPFAARWDEWEGERAWLATAIQIDHLLEQHGDVGQADPQTYAQALDQLLGDLHRYWQASDQITSTCVNQDEDHSNARWSDLVEGMRQAQAAHDYKQWVTASQVQLASDLESDFKGIDTDWEAACAMFEWVEAFTQFYPTGIPAGLVTWIARGDDTQASRIAIKGVLERATAQLDEIESQLRYVENAVIARAYLSPKDKPQSDTKLEAMRLNADFLRERMPLLNRWVACNERIENCRTLGLGALIDASLKRGAFPRDILQIFDRRFYGLWLAAAWEASPVLKRFAGDTQDRMIQQFRQLDTSHAQLAQQRLVTLLRQRCNETQAHAEQGAYSSIAQDRAFAQVYDQLVKEAGKKRSPAIRQIVRKVGAALIQLKPCWMMSPLTVSQFVESATPIFDLVIFDEASQVLTEDAICAIMRGKQLIVVGDGKQLPPTSFFSKSLADDDSDDDEEPERETAEQDRTESILTEMVSANMTLRSLRWHYRSQHESLIAFSNNEFYDGQLITFPGPAKEHRDGVRFIHVANGVYDYGGTHTNRREAERVVDLLIELAQRDPHISLGVVALSGAQQRAIREALETRFKRYPELEILHKTLDEDHPDENAFFIKNLESVQGDERDIIVLSVGYGPDKTGRVHSTFGPVNRKGGERRLNVAVTRARQRMYVVSSIHASDINPTQSVGVRTLRRYLKYAEQGPDALTEGATTVAENASVTQFDSPFEQAIYEALTAYGLILDTQVGCSGYRIDMAVRDPEQPDRYLLGIECDGASYHSSKTARDRDRLRQAHLESLGWSVHRIWSADWFAHPEREIEKILDALEIARRKSAVDGESERVS